MKVLQKHLWEKVMVEYHGNSFAGHFAAKRMTIQVSQYLFWLGMSDDIHKKYMSCIECASVQSQPCLKASK